MSSAQALLVDGTASVTRAPHQTSSVSKLSGLEVVTSLTSSGGNEIPNSAASSHHILLASDASGAASSPAHSANPTSGSLDDSSASASAHASASVTASSSGLSHLHHSSTKAAWLVSSLVVVSLFVGTL